MTREREVGLGMIAWSYDVLTFIDQLSCGYAYWRGLAMGSLDGFECSLA